MNATRIITLTTDFGVSSPYVAEMKGAILCVAPGVRIVDATHSIAPQNVTEGAFCLRQFANAFPSGTIHVAVVDPGVGTDREILLVECSDQFFIAPNNGVLSFQLEDATSVRQVTNATYWRDPVSATFHGRDIMGPVAAHLAMDESLEMLGSEFTGKLERLWHSQPTKVGGDRAAGDGVGSLDLLGEVVFVDSFGNLVTNIPVDQLASEVVEVEFDGVMVPFRKTYGSEAQTTERLTIEGGAVISLIGSGGWLEIAIKNGNAARELPDSVGKSVRLRLGEKSNSG